LELVGSFFTTFFFRLIGRESQVTAYPKKQNRTKTQSTKTKAKDHNKKAKTRKLAFSLWKQLGDETEVPGQLSCRVGNMFLPSL